ncbi:MAG: glycerate kinase [Deltaproteobacteria bacterium RBG_16_50_11]|nr:MAG: glycerate kinase [Deltaproteobacteria bacterium RBG_16_50_11]
MKKIAKTIFSKAVSAVHAYDRLREKVRIEKDRLIIKEEEGPDKVFDLRKFQRIFLMGTGKASASMAQAIEEIFGDRITKGIVTTKYGHLLPLKRTAGIEAGHPLPDRAGLEGARRMKTLLESSGPEDLIILLVSGGGSALLPLPVNGVTLEEKQEVTQLLLGCGADIKEINTIRKHISHIKGGWFARWAYPSTVVTFILSDVVGDPLDAIASGPTVADPSTFEEAWGILKKYDLLSKVAPSIETHLRSGKEGNVGETPKPGETLFGRVYNWIIGSNILALRAAEEEAVSHGFHTLILSSSIVGETRDAALFHAAIAREVVSSGHPLPRPACILSGGETTVTLKGNGRGGRNQEFALAAALEIGGLEKVVLLSGGTDGTDGPTDASGAVADHTTVQRARGLGLDPKAHLETNDAYPFFQRLGDLLITGPTQTNVMDVRILLVD